MKDFKFNVIIILSILLSIPVFSQDLGGFFKDKLKEKVQEKAEEKIEEGIDKGIDGVEEGIENSVSDDQQNDNENQDNQKKQNKKKTTEDEQITTETQEEVVVEKKKEETLKTYSKFDFISGEKVIYFDDFSNTEIGDFPANWNTSVGGEVITTNKYPGKWFKIRTDGVYIPEFTAKIPENYTVEFDFILTPEDDNGQCHIELTLFEDNTQNKMKDELYPGLSGIRIFIMKLNEHGYTSYANSESDMFSGGSDLKSLEMGVKYHAAVWVQKQRVRVYVDEVKIFDIPRALQKGVLYQGMRLCTYSSNNDPLVTNYRVAVGAPDTRSKLITEGKLVVRGINFDKGSDKIKPDSYGILKNIADVLKENPDVKVKIIGHTDSDGDDASNLTLSQKRAASVKNALSNEFGIGADRMTTDGKGEKEPVDVNTTPEGKANNRRVEFIKQ